MPISNSYQAYNTDGPGGSFNTTDLAGSFAYWTDPVFDEATTPSPDRDMNPNMVYAPVPPATTPSPTAVADLLPDEPGGYNNFQGLFGHRYVAPQHADPARTPTFALFGKPDYFWTNGGTTCTGPCVAINSGFAWDHGDYAAEINTNYVGFAGPGVKNLGLDGQAPNTGPNSRTITSRTAG